MSEGCKDLTRSTPIIYIVRQHDWPEFFFFPETVLKKDTLLLYNPKECRGGKKNLSFPLENSRPLSPWGPLDFLSTCLGIDCLSISWLPGKRDRELRRMVICTLLYLKQITSKDLLYSTWNSAQCYVVTWMGEGVGGEWIHVYVSVNPFAVHLKLSQYC